MSELKPCPHCGKTPEWQRGANTEMGVIRCACGAMAFEFLQDKATAIERWNARAFPSDEETEKLAADLDVLVRYFELERGSLILPSDEVLALTKQAKDVVVRRKK